MGCHATPAHSREQGISVQSNQRPARAKGEMKPPTRPKRRAAGTAATVAAAAGGFTTVGMGAWAGRLEAFEQFFRAMPPGNGIGFVLVQQLDPSHASLLTEVLQRSTGMPVVVAQDEIPVLPHHVYVIPPNQDMVIFHGTLLHGVPTGPRGLRLPIDAFQHSLAHDQGDDAVSVILSGTGSDGTLGLRAIFGAGGLCLVQDRATVKYDGTPAGAIKSGYSTSVRAPDQMPRALREGTPAQSVLDRGLKVASANRAFYRAFGGKPQDTVGHPLFSIGERQWDIPALHDLLETVLPRENGFERHLLDHEFAGIGRQRLQLGARRIVDSAGNGEMVLLSLDVVGPPEPAAP